MPPISKSNDVCVECRAIPTLGGDFFESCQWAVPSNSDPNAKHFRPNRTFGTKGEKVR